MTTFVFGQGTRGYFEQQGNTISIEAEDGIGYGWLPISTSNASSGYSILYPPTDTLLFTVVDDTYVNYYSSGTNYGIDPQLIVDGRGSDIKPFFITPWGSAGAFERASFLKFDVNGLSNTIVEAKVYLYCVDSGIGGGIYSLDPLSDNLNWSETQATWNNRPSTDNDGNTFQSYVDLVYSGNWYAFDVTQDLFGKGDGSYSFGLVMQEDNYTVWSSKEGSHPPYLRLRVKTTGISISGYILYYSNNNPIANVNLNLSGTENLIMYSELSGYYNFNNLPALKNYTIKASKLADSDIGAYTITTYDAALTAQAAVGIIKLSDYESIAADVSKDGEIYTYDAALIARYSVGLPNTSASHAGEWGFVPDSLYYESLNSDQTDQNFTGIILGNVHGGWSQPLNAKKHSVTLKGYDKLPDISAEPGEEIQIPLRIDGEESIISAYIEFSYDPDMLKFKRIKRTDLSCDMEIVYNNERGRLRIGAYSIKPITESGKLINLQFNVIGDIDTISELFLNRYQLNNGVAMTAQSRLVIGDEPELPLKFNLGQNYPNPFVLGGKLSVGMNANTTINYQISCQGNVSIKIYNFLGQKVRTLVNEEKQAGRYHVNWDGRNERGEFLSTGLYFYNLVSRNYIKMRRMVLLR